MKIKVRFKESEKKIIGFKESEPKKVRFEECNKKIIGFKKSDTWMKVGFSVPKDAKLDVTFCNLQVATDTNHPIYTGSYEVTPKTESQELFTKQKLMTDDVTIKAIPYYNVGNLAGGSTVYIGKEIE